MKTISIIVPVYNVEKYLEKCIKSICKQTYTQLEIILVDDGSTDSCGEICEKFKNSDNRVRVIHKENGGLSDARNAGLRIASGEYIGFVDSDDFVFEDMYEVLVKVLEENAADIAICNYQRYMEGNEPQRYEIVENSRTYSGREAIHECMEKNSPVFTPMWNKLYRARLFEGVCFPTGRDAEDVSTIYKLYYKSKRIIFSDNYLYCYCVRNISLSRTKNYLAEDSILALEERTQFFVHKGEKNIALKSDLYCMRMLIWFYVRVRSSNKELSDKFRIEFEKKYASIFRFSQGTERHMFRIYHYSPLLYRIIWSLHRGMQCLYLRKYCCLKY